MGSLFDKLGEERIEEALRRGDFDDLPGHGQPLELEDLSGVPAELRAGYVLLKGAGCLPEEMELKKQFLKLADLIGACNHENEREDLESKRDALLLRYEILRERRGRG